VGIYIMYVSRDSLKYFSSAGLGSSLYSLGADPTENTVSIVIAQQYFNCCLRIRCRGNLFTESCLAMKVYSGSAIPAFRRHITIYFMYASCICSITNRDHTRITSKDMTHYELEVKRKRAIVV
jgi:hypothetical protein